MMSRPIRYTLLILLAALPAAGAYWLGRLHDVSGSGAVASGAGAPAAGSQAAGSQAAGSPAGSDTRRVLYYRNPMGLPDTSPVPKKDSMGMDYIPVYADEAPAPGRKDRGRILYYRNPMGAPDTSPVPKKDSMGMDYIPVYENELAHPGQVRMDAARVQKLGVRTSPVAWHELARSVRAVGRIEVDERNVVNVAPRFEGWIERLHVNATGQSVARGQALFEVYSPDLYAAAQEYRLALQGQARLEQATPEARRAFAGLPESSLERLRLLGAPEAEIARLRRGGEARRTHTYVAPAGGVVLEKNAVAGARFMAGETLFKLADLSRVWLLADIPEIDLEAARIGATATISLDAFPGERFSGRVDFVYPTLDADTRNARVRVVLPNPGNRLKPGLYARVELAPPGRRALAVPESALIDSGRRQVVLVALADGVFEPRAVRTGVRGDGLIAVLDGLAEGERVVTSANFLIDAESNLKAALTALSAAQADPAAKPAVEGEPRAAGHAGHAAPAAPAPSREQASGTAHHHHGGH